jgi:hypothetical protein
LLFEAVSLRSFFNQTCKILPTSLRLTHPPLCTTHPALPTATHTDPRRFSYCPHIHHGNCDSSADSRGPAGTLAHAGRNRPCTWPAGPAAGQPTRPHTHHARPRPTSCAVRHHPIGSEEQMEWRPPRGGSPMRRTGRQTRFHPFPSSGEGMRAARVAAPWTTPTYSCRGRGTCRGRGFPFRTRMAAARS